MPIDPDDIDSFFDTDGLQGDLDAVMSELSGAYEIGALREGIVKSQAQLKAAQYAANRGGELVSGIDDTTREGLKKYISTAIDNGYSLKDLRNAIDESGLFGRSRAETIARTETATAHGQGSKEAAKDMEQDEKSWVRNQTEPDDECQDNEDAGWIGIDEDFPSGDDTIPQHPNCLPGNSHILALDVTATSKRWYDGDLVVIHTASGKNLSCTPNHPILTPSGWVAAHLLNVGGYVISSGLRQWETLRFNLDDQDVPPCIENVVEAFGRSQHSTAYPVPTSAEDFHGDGGGSEVSIIWTNRALRNSLNPPADQHLCKSILVGRSVERSFLDGMCPGDLGFDGVYAPSSGTPSRRKVGVGGLTLTPGQKSGLGMASDMNTIFTKDFVDDVSTHRIPCRDELDRVAGLVFVDEIIEIRRTPFNGHVFNLQTNTSYYVAEGIVSSNCECDVIYRTSSLYGDDEGDTTDESGDTGDGEPMDVDFVKIFAQALEPDFAMLLARALEESL